jgi:hypothetical protein
MTQDIQAVRQACADIRQSERLCLCVFRDNGVVPCSAAMRLADERAGIPVAAPNKIEYRVKEHTGSSQLCEGTYPVGTTRDEVAARVRGSWGGRFLHFGDGKFSYVAYTD